MRKTTRTCLQARYKLKTTGWEVNVPLNILLRRKLSSLKTRLSATMNLYANWVILSITFIRI